MARDWVNFPELWNSEFEFYYFDSPHKQITEDFFARVTRVIDGDTIMLEWVERDFEFPMRMLEVNAPEMSEGGLESKKWLNEQVLGKEVEIKIDPKQRVGKFGRLLGFLFADGINMNEQSLSFGFSRPFGQDIGEFPSLNKELARAEF